MIEIFAPYAVIGPTGLVVIIAVLQFIVVISALVIVGRIWLDAINIIRTGTTDQAKYLGILFGKSKMDMRTESKRIAATGIGLGSTIIILGLAILAAWIIGNHSITN